MTAATGGLAEVVLERRGDVGRIILNRPEALNALTLPMIEEMHRCIDEWERAPGSVVVLESASERAFCAGGDIRQIRQNSLDGRHDRSVAFFTAEYELNGRIAELQTPWVSLIDGICMGGGLGLSIHGTFRVVSDRAVLAMPETAIGFFPDIGASHFLSRLPGAIGAYLGLTGYRLDAADSMYTGLATHRLADHRDDIDRCFSAASVAEIRSRLLELGNTWSDDTREALDTASPQSLEVTLAALSAGRQQSLRRCLAMELDLATRIIDSHDFIEGVRAALVDKDRSPSWAEPEQLSFITVPHIGVST
jgi:enoyl-CoA hydratase/carnithine racemase